jgi:hypothetical protein
MYECKHFFAGYSLSCINLAVFNCRGEVFQLLYSGKIIKYFAYVNILQDHIYT